VEGQRPSEGLYCCDGLSRDITSPSMQLVKKILLICSVRLLGNIRVFVYISTPCLKKTSKIIFVITVFVFVVLHSDFAQFASSGFIEVSVVDLSLTEARASRCSA